MSEVTRIGWFCIGVYIGYLLADKIAPPEPPKRKSKRETYPHVVEVEKSASG